LEQLDSRGVINATGGPPYRGRALQEWKLLEPKDKVTYGTAVKALRERLDPGNQSIAALNFSQRSEETVQISYSDWRSYSKQHLDEKVYHLKPGICCCVVKCKKAHRIL